MSAAKQGKQLVEHNIKIIFWNLRSLNNRRIELEKILAEIDVFIGA